ncbi:MAG: hypothetical protein ACXW2E_00465 [Nitrososphaeraceae archaeon]
MKKFIELIISLITSFFQHSTQEKKEDIKLADATETAIVEKIRATENAVAIEQLSKTEDALHEVNAKHKKERTNAKSNNESDDLQFGSDW